MDERPRRFRRVLIAVCVLGLMVFWTNDAYSAKDGQKYRDWTVKCRDADNGKTQTCVLAQTLKRKDGEQLQKMMSTIVGRFGPDAEPGMVISVPLGVLLPAGSVVEVEGAGATKRLDFQFCNRTGCRAVMRLDRRWLDLFRAAAKARVTIQNRRRREIKMPLSLKGFSKGTEAIGIH